MIMFAIALYIILAPSLGTSFVEKFFQKIYSLLSFGSAAYSFALPIPEKIGRKKTKKRKAGTETAIPFWIIVAFLSLLIVILMLKAFSGQLSRIPGLVTSGLTRKGFL